MRRKIPSNAFEVYFSLGEGRSYRTVAERFSVSKQAITKLAAKERWQERIQEIEERSRDESDREAVESLSKMNERHLKMLKVVQGKALESLRTMPLATAMEAVRALEMTIKNERLIRGEPSERTALSVEEVTQREIRRWLALDHDAGEDPAP